MLNVIDTGKVRYELNIDSKFTIIQGNSASGKTTLLSYLDQIGINPLIKVETDYYFVRLTRPSKRNQTWESFFEQTDEEDTVYYCDEDLPELYTEEFQHVITKSRCRFIIVCRELLSHIPYSVGDVRKIDSETIGKKIINRVVPYYSYTRLNWNDYTTLVTEDSNSGYIFFSSFLQNVKSADGKSNVYKLCGTLIKSLFVVDEVGFGSEIARTYEELLKNQTNGLWLIGSFEELIIHSEFTSQKCSYYKFGFKPKLILGTIYDRLSSFIYKSEAERIAYITEIEEKYK